MQVVTVGKRRYVIGMWWQVPDRNLDRSLVLTAARSMASSLPDEQYNAVLLTRAQFALGWSEKSLRLPALAAALQEGSPENWIGCFNLGDCWWLCAMHNRLVTSEGDVIAKDAGEANRQLEILRRQVPSATELVRCETYEESIAWISPRLAGKSSRLQPLYGIRLREYAPRLLLTCLVIGCCWYGTSLYLEKQALERAVQARQFAARTKAETERLHKEITAHPERYFPQVWRYAPAPMVITSACFDQRVPLYTRGWEFASRTCSAEMPEQPENGTPTALVRAVTWTFAAGASFVDLPDNAITDGKNPRQAVDVSRLSLPGSTRSAVPLLSQGDTNDRLYELANLLAGQLSVRWLEPTKASVGAHLNVPVVQVTSPWIRAEWSITGSGLAASSLPQYLQPGRATALPGLIITNITESLTAWTYKGVVYAHR